MSYQHVINTQLPQGFHLFGSVGFADHPVGFGIGKFPIVENRNVQKLAELVLDLETTRGGNIFKVNPAKANAEVVDRFNNRDGVFCRSY